MPFCRPPSLRRRKPVAMTGPAMPVRMPKEPKMNPNEDFCLPLFSSFVIGDIKQERQAAQWLHTH